MISLLELLSARPIIKLWYCGHGQAYVRDERRSMKADRKRALRFLMIEVAAVVVEGN